MAPWYQWRCPLNTAVPALDAINLLSEAPHSVLELISRVYLPEVNPHAPCSGHCASQPSLLPSQQVRSPFFADNGDDHRGSTAAKAGRTERQRMPSLDNTPDGENLWLMIRNRPESLSESLQNRRPIHPPLDYPVKPSSCCSTYRIKQAIIMLQNLPHQTTKTSERLKTVAGHAIAPITYEQYRTDLHGGGRKATWECWRTDH